MPQYKRVYYVQAHHTIELKKKKKTLTLTESKMYVIYGLRSSVVLEIVYFPHRTTDYTIIEIPSVSSYILSPRQKPKNKITSSPLIFGSY